MDCEKFDENVIDALYGELDELTAAALRRHVESCSRCAGIYANLKHAREGSTLPLEEPPDDLEDRILAAERAAVRSAPWPKKLMRAAAWAGSHAMRPQLAMAALFMFVIGSSLLLLRAKPGTFAPTSVSERGAPAASQADEPVAATPPAATAAARSGGERGRMEGKADAPPPPAAAAEPADGAAKEEAQDIGLAEQAAAASATAAPGGSPKPAPKLEQALDTLAREGCDAALPKLREIAQGDGADAEGAKRQIEACGGGAGGKPARPPGDTEDGEP